MSDCNKDVGSGPFVGSAVNHRLRGYLVEAKPRDSAGNRPHSFRMGLSNILRLSGCSQQDVVHAQYIGWQSGTMFLVLSTWSGSQSPTLKTSRPLVIFE